MGSADAAARTAPFGAPGFPEAGAGGRARAVHGRIVEREDELGGAEPGVLGQLHRDGERLSGGDGALRAGDGQLRRQGAGGTEQRRPCQDQGRDQVFQTFVSLLST